MFFPMFLKQLRHLYLNVLTADAVNYHPRATASTLRAFLLFPSEEF